MYNRYIPRETQYQKIPDPAPQKTQNPPPPPRKGSSPEGITGRLGGLLKSFHFEKLDSGDVLLVLILLFLFLESEDNLELVIALGLMLAFGLFEKDKDESE